MKYTLVLGIEYKKYKNPATLTVSIGNKFIDTFKLERDFIKTNQNFSNIEHYWFDKLNKKELLTDPDRTKKLWVDMPTFFKIYQINDDDVKDNLEIKVENSNSDFTNGFMKNNSVISLSIVALFPSVLSQNKGEKLIKTCFKLHEGYYRYLNRYVAKTSHGKSRKEFTWPTAESFYARRENEEYEKSEIKDRNWSIGGSFTAEFPIREKHKVKYLGSLRHKEKGFCWCLTSETLFISTCKSLLNIYNEDQ
jgi:hypothetical protein